MVVAISLMACPPHAPSVVRKFTLPPNAKGYLDDRIEIELAVQLDPDDAITLTSPVGGLSLAPLAHLLQSVGARLEPSVPARLARKRHLLGYYTVRFPGHTKLQRLVDFVEQARLLGPSTIKRAGLVPSARAPNDPYVGIDRTSSISPVHPVGTQWYVYATKVDTAWSCGATGKGVVVADVDWGFDLTHDELDGQYDPSHIYNLCSGTAPVAESALSANAFTYHGTGVAGLIAAQQEGLGMQGIAFEATIWPLQAACSATQGEPCDEGVVTGNPWAAAVTAVTDAPCDGCRKVLLVEGQTCRLGNLEGSIAVNGAIKAALDSNVVVVMTAGNGGKDISVDDFGWPIEETGAIIVGATNKSSDTTLRADSNFGSRVVVSAPGDDQHDLTLSSAGRNCVGEPAGATYTECFGGTSGAAAKVAGVVALMLQKNPDLDPATVKQILSGPPNKVIDSAMNVVGGAFLDAAAAVAAADANGCRTP